MTLQDQLDELRKAILRDRSDLVSGDSDSLWTDETLLRYIQDGERRFARRVMCLRDGNTPKYTRVALRDGVTDYPLDPLVFAVVSARPEGQSYDLKRSGHMLLQSIYPIPSLTWDPAESLDVRPGAPLAFHTDETLVYDRQHRVTLSIFPAPDAAAAGTIVNLRVVRMPAGGYDLKCLTRESEIPLDYQLDVLEWAAYRAKRNNDADIGNTPNADSHRDAFEAAIVRAIRETKQRMHAPTGVRYGANGFSWSR